MTSVYHVYFKNRLSRGQRALIISVLSIAFLVAGLLVMRQVQITFQGSKYPRYKDIKELVSYSKPAVKNTDHGFDVKHNFAFVVLGCEALTAKRYPVFTRPWAVQAPGVVYINTDQKPSRDILSKDGVGVVAMDKEPSPHRRFVFMALDLYDREPDSDWYVLADDDCLLFMPNLLALVDALDPMVPHFIGGSSENSKAMNRHGRMAFGGGGAVLSAAAMKMFAKNGLQCIVDHETYPGGDEKLAACVFDQGVPFTHHPGFHQADFRGDPRGFYEGVVSRAPFISMHHIGAFSPVYPGRSIEEGVADLFAAAIIFGPDSFKRSVGTVLVDDTPRTVMATTGYRLRVYTEAVMLDRFNDVERTFDAWHSFVFTKTGWLTEHRLRAPDSDKTFADYIWEGASKPAEYRLREGSVGVHGTTRARVEHNACGRPVCSVTVTGKQLLVKIDQTVPSL